MSRSRPTSGALMPGAVILTPPSLSEILSNTSSPPWTLAAFMAYLSQNHCLETLEFTMDAERYRTAYEQIITNQEWIGDGKEHVCSLWEKLMQAYIIPYAPREVNLPSRVRDRLMAQQCPPTPPPPSELDEAVRIVYELMNDSVLVPFIESVMPGHGDVRMEDDSHDARQGRSRLQVEGAGARLDEPRRSPKFLPQLTVGRSGATSRSASASGMEREGLTDDSGSAASPSTEPMTPPTTPPTSDWTFSTSPGGLQRALTAHNNGWKKVGAKLGLHRKSRSNRRNHAPSSAPESEVMPSTTSTTPATSSSHLPLDGFSRVRHLFNPWEEPHPGKRLPLTAAEEVSRDSEKAALAGSQHVDGGRNGGMAAKELNSYRNSRPWLVRRPIRVRSRTPAPLKITTEIADDAKLAPMPAVRNVGVPFPTMATPAIPPAVLEAESEKPDAAVDAQPAAAAAVDDGPSELPLPASPPIDCQFTDFSNLLGISVQPPPEESVVIANNETETHCHAAPDEDIYGWDAELERQSQHSSPILSCPYDQDYQYRRTSMTKRSLLHRVFSMGNSPKDFNDIEVRRASSTSS
ncbi:regulator of g-protein signaling [Colletotrichum incanum]|uniref:Regulator of g-protein signaling n=1 Tax=Colletotrichum incanum TaxID=1573173 RepID=A0A162PAN9_COLIC|nr:regulator of g-protein signaling [Colletotrichum incanum]